MTLNFMPHFEHENAIFALTCDAIVSGESGDGTSTGSLQPEQVVLCRANPGFRLNCLPHFWQEKAIVMASTP